MGRFASKRPRNLLLSQVKLGLFILAFLGTGKLSPLFGQSGDVAKGSPMVAADGYRAKAFECLSLAECMNDPERRADMLRFAKMWMSLAEPMGDVPGPYELPHRG